jgi:2-polyprenyl-3-methyl-5-hydroxy-6-metoxy-1,4-benzoquinol methylase
MNKQQQQTKSFFKKAANDWQSKAENLSYGIINDRHRAVHKTLKLYPKGSSLLDIGCGTGQLAIEASKLGYKANGIDFADEMISIAKNNNVKKKTSALFETCSVFDYIPNRRFDVISAMGFIEYISLKQLDELLVFCFKNLNSNGSISIGSRNRLFNITTFNDYTDLEIKISAIGSLLEEAKICISSKDFDEFLIKLNKFSKEVNLVQNETHPITGIEVETRFQFTPSDLLKKIQSFGFNVTAIYGINYHAFGTATRNEEIISIGKEISELISDKYQSNFALLPNCSSFVMEAKKCP